VAYLCSQQQQHTAVAKQRLKQLCLSEVLSVAYKRASSRALTHCTRATHILITGRASCARLTEQAGNGNAGMVQERSTNFKGATWITVGARLSFGKFLRSRSPFLAVPCVLWIFDSAPYSMVHASETYLLAWCTFHACFTMLIQSEVVGF
jgi:hypothetical protein